MDGLFSQSPDTWQPLPRKKRSACQVCGRAKRKVSIIRRNLAKEVTAAAAAQTTSRMSRKRAPLASTACKASTENWPMTPARPMPSCFFFQHHDNDTKPRDLNVQEIMNPPDNEPTTAPTPEQILTPVAAAITITHRHVGNNKINVCSSTITR